MVKEGSLRAKKFKVKHDPDVILLRWKALRDWSIKRFYVAANIHFLVDDNIKVLIDRYVLPYGNAGDFMDLVRKFVNSWGYLTDLQKECLKQEWLSKGFPEELFDCIALKYYEMQHYITQHPTTDMALLWFSELDPYPPDAITPKEEDLTTKIETEYDTKPLENMPYWKQEGYKKGILLRKLVTVFKGYDAFLPEIPFPTFVTSVLGVVEFTLEIPSIFINEFEQYGLLIFPNPSIETSLLCAEIERILICSNPFIDFGVNTSWLEKLWIIPFASSVFPVNIQTLTQPTITLYGAYVMERISIDLNKPSISATSNVNEGKALITEIPNPSIEVSI
jgi:hypothetical protein